MREKYENMLGDLLHEDTYLGDIFKEHTDENVLLVAACNEGCHEDSFDEHTQNWGWVGCRILKENETAYKTAIGFLHAIVEAGFHPRCEFKFLSTVKNYTEIFRFFIFSPDKLVMQSTHNQFWANCFPYPTLREDMRAYVKLAAQKVEYIMSDEFEEDDAYRRRPDFFATAALTLNDPTGHEFAESFGTYITTGSVETDLGAEGVNWLADTYLKRGCTRKGIYISHHSFKVLSCCLGVPWLNLNSHSFKIRGKSFCQSHYIFLALSWPDSRSSLCR